MLRFTVRRLSTIPNPYERPARRITAEASKSLDCALSLICRYRRSIILRRVISITIGFAGFHNALALLEASLGDLRWLLSVYSSDDPFDGGGAGGLVLSLPPSPLPTLSVPAASSSPFPRSPPPTPSSPGSGPASPPSRWPPTPPIDHVEAATSLANLALDSGRNKKIIIEKGGVPHCSPFSATAPPPWMPRSPLPLPSPTSMPTASWSPSSPPTSWSPSSSRSSMPRCNSRPLWVLPGLLLPLSDNHQH